MLYISYYQDLKFLSLKLNFNGCIMFIFSPKSSILIYSFAKVINRLIKLRNIKILGIRTTSINYFSLYCNYSYYISFIEIRLCTVNRIIYLDYTLHLQA